MADQKRLWERGWTKGITIQPAAVKSKSTGSPQLYALKVFLTDGPVTKAFADKEISRTIQMRGDQTLQALHRAIFKAFDREEEHLHEFNFGKGPYDRNGSRYTLASNTKDFMTDEVTAGDVAKTTIDSLGLEVGRAFGYWFDFGDDWRHEIRVEAIEDAPPKGRFPKVVARVGESPPQYANPEELK
jgi:hypothetical protein